MFFFIIIETISVTLFFDSFHYLTIVINFFQICLKLILNIEQSEIKFSYEIKKMIL